MSQNSLMPRQ